MAQPINRLTIRVVNDEFLDALEELKSFFNRGRLSGMLKARIGFYTSPCKAEELYKTIMHREKAAIEVIPSLLMRQLLEACRQETGVYYGRNL